MDRRFPIRKFQPENFAPFFGEKTDQLRVELLTGGACNSNYLVETPDGDRFVCRIHLRGSPEAEQHITQLAKDIAPCPEYLWVGDGVSVQNYIDGQHFEPTEERMQNAGRIIGQLAQLKFDQTGIIGLDETITPFEGWTTITDGLNQLLENPKVQVYLSAKLRKDVAALLKKEALRLSEFDAYHNLVHGDFRPDNLLIKGNTCLLYTSDAADD